MTYNSIIPTNPNDPNFYPFSNFVSSVQNIKRNLEKTGLTAKELRLPMPHIYGESTFDSLWEEYKKSSMEISSVSDHSWNVQLLAQYSTVFGLNENPEKLQSLYTKYFARLTNRDRGQVISFLDLVENSQRLNKDINEQTEQTDANKDGLNVSPKKELFDAYLTILINHIHSAKVDYSDDKIEARWNGTDEMSKALLSRLDAFQKMYAPSSNREIEQFASFIKNYPNAIDLLSSEKADHLREQLINRQLKSIQFDTGDTNFAIQFEQLFPKTLDSAFFDSYYKIGGQIHAANEQCRVLQNTYQVREAVIKQALNTQWGAKQAIDALIEPLNKLEEVEKVKAFLKEYVAEEQHAQIDALTLEQIGTSETQITLLKLCFENWCQQEQKEKGQHHYDLCLQAFTKFQHDFSAVGHPIEVIEAIKRNLELAQKSVLEQVSQCKIMEYELDSFSLVLKIQPSLEEVGELSAADKVILSVIEKIKALKKQHFYYDNDKPKLVEDIKHQEDVIPFFNSAREFIDEKAKEIGENQTATESLLNIFRAVANVTIWLLSLGRCPRFFSTEPKETTMVKDAILELQQMLTKEIPQPINEAVVSATS